MIRLLVCNKGHILPYIVLPFWVISLESIYVCVLLIVIKQDILWFVCGLLKVCPTRPTTDHNRITGQCVLLGKVPTASFSRLRTLMARNDRGRWGSSSDRGATKDGIFGPIIELHTLSRTTIGFCKSVFVQLQAAPIRVSLGTHLRHTLLLSFHSCSQSWPLSGRKHSSFPLVAPLASK